jgi:hypothetical protein
MTNNTVAAGRLTGLDGGGETNCHTIPFSFFSIYENSMDMHSSWTVLPIEQLHTQTYILCIANTGGGYPTFTSSILPIRIHGGQRYTYNLSRVPLRKRSLKAISGAPSLYFSLWAFFSSSFFLSIHSVFVKNSRRAFSSFDSSRLEPLAHI